MKNSALPRCLLLLVTLNCSENLLAQLPAQDCSGAFQVTTSPEAFPSDSGYGLNHEVSYSTNSSCLMNGEENSIWLKFSICASGTLTFQLAPNNPDGDLDFALYTLPDNNCSDIIESNELRCNYSSVKGSTGLDTYHTSTSVSALGPNQCALLDAISGQQLYLLVNECRICSDSGARGFVLSFEGTADICIVGISTPLNQNLFAIYPNPNDGIIEIRNLPAVKNPLMQILDPSGIPLFEKPILSPSDIITLPLSFPNGFYFIRIFSDKTLVGIKKFIVQR